MLVFPLELCALLRKHLAFGLAQIVGEAAAPEFLKGRIGKGQPPVLIPQEHAHGQLLKRGAQQPGLADLLAKQGLMRLELRHIDAKPHQHAVFQPLVDHTHPPAIGKLLHPFEIGQGKIPQLLLQPCLVIRIVRFHAAVAAREIDRLHQRLKPGAGL
ncbi:hypothetical protein D3C87_1514200 [compost metagenome]